MKAAIRIPCRASKVSRPTIGGGGTFLVSAGPITVPRSLLGGRVPRGASGRPGTAGDDFWAAAARLRTRVARQAWPKSLLGAAAKGSPVANNYMAVFLRIVKTDYLKRDI